MWKFLVLAHSFCSICESTIKKKSISKQLMECPIYFKKSDFIPKRWIWPRWSEMMVRELGTEYLASYFLYIPRKYPIAILCISNHSHSIFKSRRKGEVILSANELLSTIPCWETFLSKYWVRVLQRIHSWKPPVRDKLNTHSVALLYRKLKTNPSTNIRTCSSLMGPCRNTCL